MAARKQMFDKRNASQIKYGDGTRPTDSAIKISKVGMRTNATDFGQKQPYSDPAIQY
jgi:hypothetical protein